MREDGGCNWTLVFLDKKRIIWKNPANGFAALKDTPYEIKLPKALPTYQENFETFKSLWTSLDYDVDLLFQNVIGPPKANEYCCLDCSFPFSPICAEPHSQFEPDPP